MMIANIEQKWCRCGCCNHKLFYIANQDAEVPLIEIKCHSCKEINIVYRQAAPESPPDALQAL
jgi:phage FluMu protein Com